GELATIPDKDAKSAFVVTGYDMVNAGLLMRFVCRGGASANGEEAPLDVRGNATAHTSALSLSEIRVARSEQDAKGVRIVVGQHALRSTSGRATQPEIQIVTQH